MLMCFFSLAAYGEEQISSYSDMSIGGRLKNGQAFRARIKLENFECKPKEKQKLNYWGVDGYCPSTIVKTISLSVNDQKIDFSETAFNDLADVTLPLGFYLMQSPNEVKLYIRGGDGVAAYTAIFFISSGKLKSRVIEYMDGDGDLTTDIKKLS